jgi:hypothetical protein
MNPDERKSARAAPFDTRGMRAVFALVFQGARLGHGMRRPALMSSTDPRLSPNLRQTVRAATKGERDG